MVKKRITFKDFGQDFLEWIIDENGTILECNPFQGSVWKRFKVLNTNVAAGELVNIQLIRAKEENLEVKYPVEKVEQIQ